MFDESPDHGASETPAKLVFARKELIDPLRSGIGLGLPPPVTRISAAERRVQRPHGRQRMIRCPRLIRVVRCNKAEIQTGIRKLAEVM